MTESFLHYLWKMKLFNMQQLKTTDGETVTVINTGEHNTDAGPDFKNAKIKIGKTTWAGQVEIHVKASEWNQHNHQHDSAYNNVILHVVYESNTKIINKKGTNVACIEVKELFDKNLFQRYQVLQSAPQSIPCSKLISSVKEIIINTWLQRVLIERLKEKTKFASKLLLQNKGDWEQTFYQLLARAFGTKLNTDAFELTSKALPLQILAKNKKTKSFSNLFF